MVIEMVIQFIQLNSIFVFRDGFCFGTEFVVFGYEGGVETAEYSLRGGGVLVRVLWCGWWVGGKGTVNEV